MNIQLNTDDNLLIMKIVHYFITKEDYHPVIIKGIEDEIWLENKNNSYSIIRIVLRHIQNKDQYEFDMERMMNVAKQIKRKNFDFSMNMLSLYMDVSENDIIENDDKNYTGIAINYENDLYCETMMKNYKSIQGNLIQGDNEFDLINQITKEISEKNVKETEKREKIMTNKKTIITYLIIAINLILFILMYTNGEGSENVNTLINYGANYIPLVKSGEYIRLITCAFLHIGFLHLIFNMYSLAIVGSEIESLYGKIKYLLIYFISAIMGSLFTVVFSSENTVSAGASGAIFGLLGALLYFGFTYRGYIGNNILRQVIPIVLVNLILGFSMPNIGVAAHIGGLIGGYTISMALGIDVEKDNKNRINGIIITTVLFAFMIYMGFFR